MISRKRMAQALPFGVLFGAAGVGILATPWFGVTSPEAFEMALAGVCVFFVGRWFSRRVRHQMRSYGQSFARPRKLSQAEKRDQRRADQRMWR